MSQIELFPQDKYNEELIANVHPPDWQNPEPNGRYNLLVIGGGSAGMVAAIGAAGVGAKVALVEKGLLGGDCLNMGCVPSKSIIRSASIFGDMRRAADLGVHVPEGVHADFGAVMARMRRIRADLSHHDSVTRITNMGIDLFLGEGHFTGSNTLEVDGKRIEFKKAVIATGSRPATVPIPGLEDAGYLTNESVFFRLTELPPRLAVVGGGPIGVELAQTFQRLGSQVTIFDMFPQILGREDADAAAIVQKSLLRDGVDLCLGVQIKEVKQVDGAKVVVFTAEGGEQEIAFDDILLAVGRRPNVEGLDLEAAAVAYDKKGVTVNDRLQTTNGDIYAAGDVALKYQFTHTANAAARIVIQNALFLRRKRFSTEVIPWVTFSDPEVAHVGLYANEAESQGMAVEPYTVYLKDIDRGRADGVEEGFVKILTKKGSDKILGATIVGPHAGELISEVTLAMVAGLGLGKLTEVIHPYPTYAEAVRMAADAYFRTRLTPRVKSLFDRWLAWQR